jgi:hypothetical protein
LVPDLIPNFSLSEIPCFGLKNIPFQGYYNYVSIELDGKYIGRFKIDNNEIKKFTYDVSDKNLKVHTIKIVKATEAAMGEVYFDGSGIDAVSFQPKPGKN